MSDAREVKPDLEFGEEEAPPRPQEVISWWCGKHVHERREDAEKCITDRRAERIERVRE